MTRLTQIPILALVATAFVMYGCGQSSSSTSVIGQAPIDQTRVRTAGARAGELYLSCNLVGRKSEVYHYSFAFNPDEETLFWIEGGIEFDVIRNTSTQLWSDQEKYKFRDFPHDMTDFRLNRVTGVAEVTYLMKPTPVEVSECEKEEGAWWCDSYSALPEHDQTGSCKVVDRIIE